MGTKRGFRSTARWSAARASALVCPIKWPGVEQVVGIVEPGGPVVRELFVTARNRARCAE